MIRVLPEEIVAQIAAGEAIGRPAFVAKELIENAIDAGASTISVELVAGGLDVITVADDGRGVPAADLPLLFQHHATSKIGSVDDLVAVQTLGYRGEALACIAAVAQVEITTRAADDPTATLLRADRGTMALPRRVARQPGTTVTVRRLFADEPSLRQGLKSPRAETALVHEIGGQIALGYPETRFTLKADGRQVLNTSGHGSRREAALGVFGAELAAELVEIEAEDAAEGLVVRGLLGPPGLDRSTRGQIVFFVNRRLVRSPLLLAALEEAYRPFLDPGRHPLAVVDLRLPPEAVSTRHHPRKMEARFWQEGPVYRLVNRAVRDLLVRIAPVPVISVPPSVPGTFGTRSGISFDERPGSSAESEASTPDGGRATPAYRPIQAAQGVPVLRVVGQVNAVYIIAEGPDGLYLVDQHTAHERVLYERFTHERASRTVQAQALLEPLPVELSPRLAATVAERQGQLAELGFAFEPFGEQTVLVRAIPALLAQRARANLRETILQVVEALEAPARTGVAAWADPLIATMACHAAIRAGEILTHDEMRELIRQLEQAENPFVCPHGRPVVVHLSAAQLEREFGRR